MQRSTSLHGSVIGYLKSEKHFPNHHCSYLIVKLQNLTQAIISLHRVISFQTSFTEPKNKNKFGTNSSAMEFGTSMVGNSAVGGNSKEKKSSAASQWWWYYC